jgi:hypothetical protein
MEKKEAMRTTRLYEVEDARRLHETKGTLVDEPWKRLQRALERVASAFGTTECFWNASFTPGQQTVIKAYIGPRHLVIAEASHDELFIAQRKLAWELEEILHAS